MSGYGSIESAVEAMKLGAVDFLSKPFKINELRDLLVRIEGQLAANNAGERLRQEVDKLGGLSLLIGRSPEMQQIYRVVLRAATSYRPVLIRGEQGTGKELLARSIHLATRASNFPFIPIDCCSLMPTLLDSELFGHVKGSFPGAVVNKPGLLANAECGTVFLDEVADLSLDVQAKLVRVLQEQVVRPLGSANKAVPLRARIVASSSRDLATAVAAGKFRQDLYYCLSVLVVPLPSLRERREDIPLFVEYFLRKISKERGTKKTVSEAALRSLTVYDWPGNVRELESVLARACTLGVGASIVPSDFPSSIAVKQARSTDEISCKSSLAEIERESVLKAMRDSGGDKVQAARLLGISRTTLYRKLNEYKR